MDESDRIALKIHGFLFSDSDSQSSSDEDGENISPTASRNHTREKYKAETPSFTDSGQSSGLSDFDDDYYAVQPPPVAIEHFKDRIVKIKAKKQESKVNKGWDACNKETSCVPPISAKAPPSSKYLHASFWQRTIPTNDFVIKDYSQEFPALSESKGRRVNSRNVLSSHNDNCLETNVETHHKNSRVVKSLATGTIKKHLRFRKTRKRATDRLQECTDQKTNDVSPGTANFIADESDSDSSPKLPQVDAYLNWLQEFESVPIANEASNSPIIELFSCPPKCLKKSPETVKNVILKEIDLDTRTVPVVEVLPLLEKEEVLCRITNMHEFVFLDYLAFAKFSKQKSNFEPRLKPQEKIEPKKSRRARLQGAMYHNNKQRGQLNKEKLILKKKTNCDTKKDLYIAPRTMIPDLIRHQLVRNNNAILARVRLARERRRRRFCNQLGRLVDHDHANQNFLIGCIFLLIITFLFYCLTLCINMYLRSIFVICNNK